MPKTLFFVLAITLIPADAFAYVDPGILGVVYQAFYALVFGGIALLVLRPWNYVRSLWSRMTSGNDRLSKSDQKDDKNGA